MASPVKILVIRLSSIGDVVLTSPVVRCLSKQLTGAVVHVCTRPAYEPIVAHNPYIEKNHYLTGNPFALIRQLRAERFDYVVDLQDSAITRLIRLALGVRSYSIDNLRWRKWLLLRAQINVMPKLHVVDRYMETVRPLGVENDEQGLDYFIPYKDQVEPDWLPPTHQQDYVVYIMGSRHVTKRLPLHRMIELCRKINHPIILVGDQHDRDRGNALVEVLGERQMFNACGLFNLNQSASILQNARLVFSHDTGMIQVAAAFKRNIYSLWGSSSHYYGRTPYKTMHAKLEKHNLNCRPCTVSGSAQCPKKHFRCMNELPFDFEMHDLRKKRRA